MATKQRVTGDDRSPDTILGAAFSRVVPEVYSLLETAAADFDRLTVKQRGRMDWLVIARRFSEDGSPEVLFGSGYSFIGALLGLEGSMHANRWRPDKPWDGAG